MFTSKYLHFVLGLCAVISVPIYAQNTTSLHAVVGDVTDNRTTGAFNAECKVELKFTGDAAADAASVREVRVTRAVDETGRDLVLKEKDPFGNSGFGSHSGALRAEIKLRNPSRNASVIKLVEGEVELFSPTESNGGILVIKDILKHPAEPIQNPVLKKFGIEIIYLTKESYDAKKKEIEAQNKSNAGGAVGEAFGDLFKGMFTGMMSSDSQNSLKLYIKDPDKRVIDFELQDSAGKALKTRSSWAMNGMHDQGLAAPAPPDAQLLIHLATPEATKSFPFKLENIPLP